MFIVTPMVYSQQFVVTPMIVPVDFDARTEQVTSPGNQGDALVGTSPDVVLEL